MFSKEDIKTLNQINDDFQHPMSQTDYIKEFRELTLIKPIQGQLIKLFKQNHIWQDTQIPTLFKNNYIEYNNQRGSAVELTRRQQLTIKRAKEAVDNSPYDFFHVVDETFYPLNRLDAVGIVSQLKPYVNKQKKLMHQQYFKTHPDKARKEKMQTKQQKIAPKTTVPAMVKPKHHHFGFVSKIRTFFHDFFWVDNN